MTVTLLHESIGPPFGAAEFMASRNVGAVCVGWETGKLLGVFSERDVLRRVVVQKRESQIGKRRVKSPATCAP